MTRFQPLSDKIAAWKLVTFTGKQFVTQWRNQRAILTFAPTDDRSPVRVVEQTLEAKRIKMRTDTI